MVHAHTLERLQELSVVGNVERRLALVAAGAVERAARCEWRWPRRIERSQAQVARTCRWRRAAIVFAMPARACRRNRHVIIASMHVFGALLLHLRSLLLCLRGNRAENTRGFGLFKDVAMRRILPFIQTVRQCDAGVRI